MSIRSLGGAVLALLLSGCARSLIYHPSIAAEEGLVAEARAQGLAPWTTDSGERIGWRRSAPSGTPATAPVLLVFHGNAGHALHRAHLLQAWAAAPEGPPWDVRLVEYPGFGSRAGTPSESALQAAAVQALRQLEEEGLTAPYVLGESLGGGVAAYLAGRYPDRVQGVLLVTPFTSLSDVGAHHYPRLAVNLLLRERYDNVAALGPYRGPVAIILAGNDEVVPAALGQRLYDTYAGPKHLWVQPQQSHNTIDYDLRRPEWRQLLGFLRSAPPAD